MRFVVLGILAVALCWSAAPMQQDPAPGIQPPQDQYFSGTVTALSDSRITVLRTVFGTESTTKVFIVTPETRFEGKPKLKARVTVRFVGNEDGDRAVHVLVRPASAKK